MRVNGDLLAVFTGAACIHPVIMLTMSLLVFIILGDYVRAGMVLTSLAIIVFFIIRYRMIQALSPLNEEP